MKFTLEIKLGNAAMQCPHDVAYVLTELAKRFDDDQDGFDIRDKGKVRDINGNAVGKWEVSE